MAVKRAPSSATAETDMTPMIDVTFQLIAFFMVLLNFGEADRERKVHLPASALAKPPETPYEDWFSMQLTANEFVYIEGARVPLSRVPEQLRTQSRRLANRNMEPKFTTVIIRADALARTSDVHRLIKLCQDEKFEKFALRVDQKLEQ